MDCRDYRMVLPRPKVGRACTDANANAAKITCITHCVGQATPELKPLTNEFCRRYDRLPQAHDPPILPHRLQVGAREGPRSGAREVKTKRPRLRELSNVRDLNGRYNRKALH